MTDQTTLPADVASIREDLLTQAFTHRSLRAHSVAKHETNERLEFLGDAVIELCVSEYLIARFPTSDEGLLTRYRAAIVRTESLASVANELGLGAHLKLGPSEYGPLVELSDSLLADLFEAITGALYTDKGYATTCAFLEKYLLSKFSDLDINTEMKDPKSLLQEKVQALGLPTPVYEIIRAEGPDHSKTFTAAINLPGRDPAVGTGASKQKAEQAAAEDALNKYFSSGENLI